MRLKGIKPMQFGSLAVAVKELERAPNIFDNLQGWGAKAHPLIS